MKRFRRMILAVLAWIATAGPTASATSRMMDLRIVEGKVMACIPASMMGRRVLMASLIEQTSDSGEGLAGQMSDNCVSLVFSLDGEHLVVAYPPSDQMMHSVPAEWKRYRIDSFTPEGDVVVDLSDFFREQYSALYTFPQNAYNSMGGQVRREHKIVKESSGFVKTDSAEGAVSVLCDFYYHMDGYVMGVMKIAGDYSLRALVRKVLFFPREEAVHMPEKEESSDVGAYTMTSRGAEAPLRAFEEKNIIKRWRIEPSDSVAWMNGEIVPPVRQVIFRIDTLVPPAWKPYVREGIEVWNEAFRQAGFENALKSEDFGTDSLSADWSPYVSRIIFAPSGMEQVEVSSLYDDDDGEIFSSTICLHSSALQKYRMGLIRHTAASDPRVRGTQLPDYMTGRLVKYMVMQAVGKALGLKENAIASAAYPTDSLRSVSFTRTYGLTASVMESDVYNYVAQPEDVAAGTEMMPSCPGPYDVYAVKWLYGPEGSAVGSGLTKFAPYPDRKCPAVCRGDLGDDVFLSMDYWVKSQKKLFAGLLDWYLPLGQDFIVRVVESSTEQYARNIVQLTRYVGGYSREEDVLVSLPQETQSKAVREVMARLRDMDWFLDVKEGILPYGTNEYIGEVYRTNIFNTLLGRVDSLNEGLAEDGFYKIISEELFPAVGANRSGLSIEMVWQDAYISFLAKKMETSAVAFGEINRLHSYLQRALPGVRGECAEHYRYLLFTISRSLKNNE